MIKNGIPILYSVLVFICKPLYICSIRLGNFNVPPFFSFSTNEVQCGRLKRSPNTQLLIYVTDY